MGERLARIQSKSKREIYYDIIKGKDGVTYCTCWQWKLNRTCKHLDEYFKGMGPKTRTLLTTPNMDQRESKIMNIIDEIGEHDAS